MWTPKNSGFIPAIAAETIPNAYNYSPLIMTLSNLSSMLPSYIKNRVVREEIVYQLRLSSGCYDVNFPYKIGDRNVAERAFQIYGYLANAYLFAENEMESNRIPKEIAIPLVALSKICERNPVLTYASCCLSNWRKINFNGDFSVENLELIQSISHDKKSLVDEELYFLSFIEIEQIASPVISLIAKKQSLEDVLNTSLLALIEMNLVISKMPENPVSRYISKLQNIIYEGCFDNEPQNFLGVSFGQSPIFHVFCEIFGVNLDSYMNTAEYYNYMPKSHFNFILDLKIKNKSTGNMREHLTSDNLKMKYNRCISELIKLAAIINGYTVQAQEYLESRIFDISA